MLKKIVILILFVSLIALGIKYLPKKVVETSLTTNTTSTSTETTTTSTRPSPTKKDDVIKAEAWKVFEAYLVAAKANNLVEVKRLSYQLSDECLDSAKIEECNARMNTAYKYGIQFKLDAMKYMVYDDKQIIMAGEYNQSLEGNAPSFTRGVLYFVREGSEIKFLSLNPFQGIIVIRKENEATTTVIGRLLDATDDTDLDYLPDIYEMCTGVMATVDCVKSDIKKRDTDGDGYWDSTESLFYKR